VEKKCKEGQTAQPFPSLSSPVAKGAAFYPPARPPPHAESIRPPHHPGRRLGPLPTCSHFTTGRAGPASSRGPQRRGSRRGRGVESGDRRGERQVRPATSPFVPLLRPISFPPSSRSRSRVPAAKPNGAVRVPSYGQSAEGSMTGGPREVAPEDVTPAAATGRTGRRR
jgi:hypothetical protein